MYVKLEPGRVLAERYRIDHVVGDTSDARAYLGTHLESKQRIRIVELPHLVVDSLHRALLVTHPSLSTLLEILSWRPGWGLIVCEDALGMTLDERLQREPPLSVIDAVAIALQLADALVVLHQRRIAHGLMRPAAVVLSPQANGAFAVLGYAAKIPSPNPYRCPELRTQDMPSRGDDLWALAAVLHHMLLGRPPPLQGYLSSAEVVQTGISDPELVRLLTHCLASRPEERISLVPPVRDALANWRQAAAVQRETSAASAEHLTQPAAPSPLRIHERPTPVVPANATAQPVPEDELVSAENAPTPYVGNRRLPPALWGALLAMVLAVPLVWRMWGAVRSEAGSPVLSVSVASHQQPEAGAPVASTTPTRTAPAMSARQPTVSSGRPLTGDELGACLAAQLPPGSFTNPPAAEWLCEVTDPRRGAELVRSALVRGSPPGAVTQGMSVWSRLHWYRMAGFAVVRARCCTQTAPLVLPPMAKCPPTERALNDLVRAIRSEQDIDPSLRQYTRSIRCHSVAERDRLFGQEIPLGGGQQAAFRELMALRPPR